MTNDRNPLPQNKGRANSVLVIDDSDIDRQVIADILALAGYTVHQLPTPIGATRKARDLGVGLVVIDQNLPSLDGSKLASLFRNAGLQDLKVVLTSSADEISMLEITKRAKADAFVAKQRLRDDLVATVRRLLAK
ncbi:MAG TPA: response regulator [Polyangiales bacterium]|nr:response regulator [Polyangiales bacterium]